MENRAQGEICAPSLPPLGSFLSTLGGKDNEVTLERGEPIPGPLGILTSLYWPDQAFL